MRTEDDSRTPSLPRLLVFKLWLAPLGGDSAVTVYALEALRGSFDLTTVSLNERDVPALNTFYGTSLEQADFVHRRLPLSVRCGHWLLRKSGALARLQHALVCRWLRRQAKHYDLVLSINNEIDVGRFAAQYIHDPYGPVPERGGTGVHGIRRRLLAIYYHLSDSIAPLGKKAVANNLTLVNSEWTGRRFRSLYGDSEPVTLYPPVPDVEALVPWESRAHRFVSNGRLASCKRHDLMIEIVDRLRERGHDVRLEIIGSYGDTYDHIAGLAASRSWVTLHHSIPRKEVLRILGESRYGIHAMIDEHFGMAVAEMAAAGCIPFVHASAGPKEIVGDARMTWSTIDDAVARIEHVLGDTALQHELRAQLAERVRAFSLASFGSALRSHVAGAVEKARVSAATETRAI